MVASTPAEVATPGDVPRGAGRRPSARALVALACGSLVLTALGCGGVDGAAPATQQGAGPAAIGVDRLAEQRAQAPLLGALVSGDGRRLRLFVVGGAEAYAAGSLTAEVGDPADGAGAGGQALPVMVRRVGAGAPSVAAGAPPLVCRLAHDVHVLDVVLDVPLGGRPLVDRSNGSVLAPVLAPAVLRPAELPAGWRLLDEHPLREGDRQTGWTQRYGAADGSPTVSVVQRLASLGPIERYGVDRAEEAAVAVRGTTAQWSRQANADATALVWTEPAAAGAAPAWTVALSSSSSGGATPALGRAVLEPFAASMVAGADLPPPAAAALTSVSSPGPAGGSG